MSDLIQEFLAETTESLSALDADIVKLKKNPNDTDIIGRIFRLVHTIKGTCGFLDLPRLEAVTHHSENIMSRYRDGSLQVTAASVSLILEVFDRIKEIVAGVAATEKEPAGDDTALIAKLGAALAAKTIPAPVIAATEEGLMALVNELVLTRNQLLDILGTQQNSPFAPALQRLDQIVSALPSQMWALAKDLPAVDTASSLIVAADSDRKIPLLIFNAGEEAAYAVPLTLISRLENVDTRDIETTGGQNIIQYNGALVPLIPFSDKVKLEGNAAQPVIIFSDSGMSVGLMVDKIVDIREGQIDVKTAAENNNSLLGSAVIHDQAMDVIDVGHFFSITHSDWLRIKNDNKPQEIDETKKVLLVDDSPFFRNVLSPILATAGYKVVSVQNGRQALALCNTGEKFSVIISDIEMPDMSGYEFAERVKADDSKWKNVPMVALSSHATALDLDRGKAAGFADYVAKFDREALLRSIAQLREAA